MARERGQVHHVNRRQLKAIFTDNGTTIKAREQQLSSLSSKCVDTRGNVKWCVARLAYLQDFDGLVNGVYLRHVRNRAFFDKKVAERAFVSHLMAVAGIEASDDNSRPVGFFITVGHWHPHSGAIRDDKNTKVSAVVKGNTLIDLAKRFRIPVYHVQEGMTSTACPSCIARDLSSEDSIPMGKLKPVNTVQVRTHRVSTLNEDLKWISKKEKRTYKTHRRQRCTQWSTETWLSVQPWATSALRARRASCATAT